MVLVLALSLVLLSSEEVLGVEETGLRLYEVSGMVKKTTIVKKPMRAVAT